MGEIKVFENERFGSLRTIKDDVGEPWFVASDVAKALGYRDAEKLTRRLDDDEKDTRSVGTLGGNQKMTVINEAGLYNAILGSKIETAKTFKRWVTHEVLPEIRKHGAYVASDGTESDEELFARALIAAQRTIGRKNRLIEEQREQIDEMRPKALFADAVAASDGTCLVGEVAKMLRQTGVQVGQNRLFEMLRNDGLLGKSGSNKNVPTQYAMENGWFRIKETTVLHSDGHVTLSRTPKVTGKGQRYLLKKYGPERMAMDD